MLWSLIGAYAVDIGKNIDNLVVRLQYIYQRATEFPMNNEGVKVKNLRVIINFKITLYKKCLKIFKLFQKNYLNFLIHKSFDKFVVRHFF